jgi:hypothetical protein
MQSTRLDQMTVPRPISAQFAPMAVCQQQNGDRLTLRDMHDRRSRHGTAGASLSGNGLGLVDGSGWRLQGRYDRSSNLGDLR